MKGEEFDEDPWYFDDMSGKALDTKLVQAAREEEMHTFKHYKVYRKVPIDECYRNTGKTPITTKWIDINQGDEKKPKYRSRNVAREIPRTKRNDFFASTPPLEVMKLLLSTLASGNKGERLMVADVQRAYFHAKARDGLHPRDSDTLCVLQG